ncbi:tyrosine-type recombinase/integrase [Acanthopleuribacter pedis]|uniref:Tyrosine-type recombinase/integrase n=1 Tax=Acanthopleuribacter pedis TaxID=442870 RepID=A0A8J7QA98_9BACT|nr:tyrosine-type recombinase/integrase [Acanthopleuribacter pedis]MBO1317051.1 tyrosine-type recombinase/integrase [Acanthopleuribacter pedis]
MEAWDVESARKEARGFLHLCDLGQDPRKKKTDCEEMQDALVSQPEDQPITLGVTIETAMAEGSLKPNTIQNYGYTLRRHFSDWMSRPVSEISIKEQKVRHKEILKISKCETKSAFQMLSSMWNKAYAIYTIEEERDFPACPISALKLTDLKWQKEQLVVTKKNLGSLARAFVKLYQSPLGEPDRSHLLCYLLGLFTGFRGGECRKLKWEYISFTDGTITLPGHVVKNSRRHIKPIGPFVLDLLKKRYDERDSSSPYVFPGFRDRKGTHIAPYSELQPRIVAETGIKFTPHALRRTFASLAELLGVPRSVLKAFLNHQGDVTDGYVRDEFDPDTNRSWMVKIENNILKLAKVKRNAA